MKETTCKNCKNFHQHYALDGQKLHWVDCGHCGVERTRSKKPDAMICKNFSPTEPDEAAFVNKEYLSKALLQYMMNLELLPNIERPSQDDVP